MSDSERFGPDETEMDLRGGASASGFHAPMSGLLLRLLSLGGIVGGGAEMSSNNRAAL